MTKKTLLTACLTTVALASSGCFLAVAGVVEASKGEGDSDPMGKEYQGVNGEIGWYEHTVYAKERAASLVYGLRLIGCGVPAAYTPGSFVPCPRRPWLGLTHFQQKVYRLCAPGTDRMQCRMAWEAVHDEVKRRAGGHRDGD